MARADIVVSSLSFQAGIPGLFFRRTSTGKSVIKFDVKTNFSGVQKSLQELETAVADRVIVRSLNRTAEIAKTAANKEIRSDYNISAEKVRNQLLVSKARITGRKLMVTLEAVGTKKGKRAINLIAFAERSVSLSEAKRRKKKGTLGQIAVKIKKGGRKKLLGQYAFIGNKGRTIFTRKIGSSVSGRLPIAPLVTIDVPQMFNQRRINSVLINTIESRFPVVFERELKFELARIGPAIGSFDTEGKTVTIR